MMFIQYRNSIGYLSIGGKLRKVTKYGKFLSLV
jgi:hypothetical protein